MFFYFILLIYFEPLFRKEDLLNFIYYIVQLFKMNTKLHHEYKIEDEENLFRITNQISQKFFNNLLKQRPAEDSASELLKIKNNLNLQMSKSFKIDNYYKLALKKRETETIKNIQEALQSRLIQAETHKISPSQEGNSELIVTRKNQNIFMKIFTGTFYKPTITNENKEKYKNETTKRVESKDFSYFLDSEYDLEDLDEWSYDKFSKTINEKINNELLYKKLKDPQEEFYHIIVNFFNLLEMFFEIFLKSSMI